MGQKRTIRVAKQVLDSTTELVSIVFLKVPEVPVAVDLTSVTTVERIEVNSSELVPELV